MKVSEATLPGVMLVEPRVFRDERGFFVETFTTRAMEAAGIFWIWVQRKGGPMEETVHATFIAGHLMVLGANVMFFAFILHLAISERETEGAAHR